MQVPANGRAGGRRSGAAPQAKKTSRRPGAYTFLLSCCVFFAVLCVCLVAVLVLIGKHLYHNQKSQTSTSKTLHNNHSVLPRQESLTYRLPKHVRPLHYDLTLSPNLHSGEYRGSVNITLEITESLPNITLHSKKLRISHPSLISSNGSDVLVVNVVENLKQETVDVMLEVVLSPGTYYLNLNFDGNLLNKTVGFYRSRYRNSASNNIKRYVASFGFVCFKKTLYFVTS